MKCIYALCLALLLAGCQRTLLEQVPATEVGCDAALVGRWLSVGEGDEADGEVTVDIDARCQLQVSEQREEGVRHSAPTPLKTFRLGRRTALAVDAHWANTSFDVSAGPLDTAGDVYVYAYALRRNQLKLLPLDHRALAQRALENKLEADVLLQDGSLTVRLRGKPADLANALKRKRSFERGEPLRFVRGKLEPEVERE